MSRVTSEALLLCLLIPGLAVSQSEDPVAKSSGSPAATAAAPAEGGAAQVEPKASPDWPPPSSDGESDDPKAAEQKRLAARAAAFVPPDGNWLIDAEGRSYFVRLRPKKLPYTRIGESSIRIVYGGDYDLAGEDEENFWLKIYRPDEEAPAVKRRVSVPPTPAELAASAATFQAPLADSDRLHFRSFDSGLPTSGLWRNGFDLADVDGDGQIDFVHAPPRRSGDQPKAFVGDGKGTWRPFRTSVPSGLLDYGDIKVADFNGDGKPDLATASHLRGISVFVGDGSGKFASWGKGLDFVVPRAGYDGGGFSSRRIEVLDWNKDGKPDLLALSEGPRIRVVTAGTDSKVTGAGMDGAAFGPKVYLNNGDGSWRTLAETGPRVEIFGDDLAVADFDGDGRLDFLTSTNVMSRQDLLYMQGEKVGGPWKSVDLPVRPKAYVNAVANGDFDRDGRVDIALTYTSFELGVVRSGVDLYLGRRGGAWERRPAMAREGRVALGALDAGDIDGDKYLDLVATDHDGGMTVLLGDGKGGFTRELSPETEQPRGNCRGYGLRIFDLDLDGQSEIVASYAGEANPLYDPKRCPGRGGVAVWTLDSPK